jgi:hypothetical protein
VIGQRPDDSHDVGMLQEDQSAVAVVVRERAERLRPQGDLRIEDESPVEHVGSGQYTPHMPSIEISSTRSSSSTSASSSDGWSTVAIGVAVSESMGRERTGEGQPQAYGGGMSDQPQFDIAEARAAIAEAETQLETGTPARAEILAALHELRADIANGEQCEEALQALRTALDRAS